GGSQKERLQPPQVKTGRLVEVSALALLQQQPFDGFLVPANDAGGAAPPESQPLGLMQKRRMFEEAEDALQDARRLAFRDEDFFHNFDDDQWSEYEKAKLEERGQPLYTHNRCKKKINTLKGMEQRSRTDPRAYPRKPDMEAMADVATEVLNAVDDKTGFDAKASRMFADLTISGIEAVEVPWDQDADQVVTDKIRYDELFYDPRSREEDFSDARYIGYAKWWDIEEARLKYPDRAEDLVPSQDASNTDTEYEDRPTALWTSRHSGRQRIRIIVMYYRANDGIWRLSHFTGYADLFDQVSPWLDDKDKPICGIVAQACYKDRENRCYGVLRDLIGPQKELNHYRSKMWHHANNRRTWGSDGAFADIGEAKREMAKVDGHVRVNPGFKIGEDWGFVESAEDVQIFSVLLQQAEAEIGIQSPNEALVGRQGSSQSGRAGEVQRDAGMTEEHDVFDLHRQFKETVYKHMFWRARQFWSEPDYLRVTNEEDAVQFIALNEPIVGPFGDVQGVRNQVAQMDVDIVVKSMPEVATLQAEQYAKLVDALPMLVQAPPAWAKVILRASQLSDKRELEQLLDQASQPQQPNPAEQAALQIELQDKEASIAERRAKAFKTGEEGKAQALRNNLGIVS
ncbi:MAG: hypothetical protein AAGJ50_02955, partial [Pseudomonadota bacterium]